MDFIKKAAGGSSSQSHGDQKHSGGGGIGDKLNNAAGGGAKGEKNEDMLDKGKILLKAPVSFSSFLRLIWRANTNPAIGIDYVQEKYLHGGDQKNESAAEQAKDKKIAGFIRNQYKGATGKEFPIKEKHGN